MRIVSLLPSITEIICALDKQDELVGRSHECNFPESTTSLPACTKPKFQAKGNSYEIDQQLRALLQEGLSIYSVDETQLKELDPDVIITQDHCEVFAASLDDVKQAVSNRLNSDIDIISVSPADLSSVISSIRTIAEALDANQQAETLMQKMKTSLQEIQATASQFYRPEVLALEWLKPLMSAGNWIPELIQLAGGLPLGAEAGSHSPQIEWDNIRQMDPPVITITPCGYSIEQTLNELSLLTGKRGWEQLQAVKNKQVFIMDGDHYFNRPGPRLVESTKILAEILHPGHFRKNEAHPGWINVYNHQFQQTVDQL